MKDNGAWRAYGVDFSGAREAGRKIWLGTGEAVDGTLYLDACCPATALTGGDTGRRAALAAVRALITVCTAAAFGFDFPFALPQALVPETCWVDFALGFGARYPDVEAFRYACREASGWRELKRETDVAARTPFSPYNLRIYRQTYYGIRDVLAPLVSSEAISVVPMQPPRPDTTPVLEVCPASMLKRADRYRPYKGRRPEYRARRKELLDWLSGARDVVLVGKEIQRLVLDDGEGDALDALLATVITFRAVMEGTRLTTDDEVARVEGYVFA
ncbi:MAG: DUF429 domain-containing protein [Anaerolineae bacterium]